MQKTLLTKTGSGEATDAPHTKTPHVWIRGVFL